MHDDLRIKEKLITTGLCVNSKVSRCLCNKAVFFVLRSDLLFMVVYALTMELKLTNLFLFLWRCSPTVIRIHFLSTLTFE